MKTGLSRILISFFLSLATFLAANAQDYTRPVTETYSSPNTSKVSLGISVGAAIPIQDFGSSNVKGSFWDFNSPDSTHLQGFARTGFHFDVTLSYLFSDNVGGEIMIGGNNNPVDINAFQNALGLPATSSFTSYYTGEYLIGPYFYYPLGKQGKFKITGSILVGIVHNSYPTFTVALNDTTSYTRNIASSNLTFAYSANVGLSCAVSDNIDVLLNIGYTGATIKYPNWQESESIIAGNYILVGTFNHSNDVTSMSTGIIKPTIGLVFHF